MFVNTLGHNGQRLFGRVEFEQWHDETKEFALFCARFVALNFAQEFDAEHEPQKRRTTLDLH